MAVSDDLRFAFDVQGFLHLAGALNPDELDQCQAWAAAAERCDLRRLNEDDPEAMVHQLNRPLSRVLDAEPRLAALLDHPSIEPLLAEFLGPDYKHIDNDLYHTPPGDPGGKWHRGVAPHPTGHVLGGRFICPMVRVFWCLTDVGPGEGELVAVPGSHRARFAIDMHGRLDLPAQRIFDHVAAGDAIVLNEATLHRGRPNRSQRTRQTLAFSFGRHDAGPWPGYRPRPETLERVSARQRAILTNLVPVWSEPTLT